MSSSHFRSTPARAIGHEGSLSSARRLLDALSSLPKPLGEHPMCRLARRRSTMPHSSDHKQPILEPFVLLLTRFKLAQSMVPGPLWGLPRGEALDPAPQALLPGTLRPGS